MQYGYKPGDGYKPVDDSFKAIWDRQSKKPIRYGKCRHRFTPEQERLMGTVSDGEIAKLSGCERTAVLNYRNKHGIAAYKPTRKPRVKTTNGVTSRQITADLVREVVTDHPTDTLSHLQARTGASEAQCIIALRRDTRRRSITYHADTQTYSVGTAHALTNRRNSAMIRG